MGFSRKARWAEPSPNGPRRGLPQQTHNPQRTARPASCSRIRSRIRLDGMCHRFLDGCQQFPQHFAGHDEIDRGGTQQSRAIGHRSR